MQTVPTFGLGNLDPSGLSANGVVCGRFIASYDSNGYYLPHIYAWSARTGTGQDIGSLGGTFTDTQGVSTPINAAGQIAVRAQTANGETHAAYWDAASGLIDIGTLGGNDSAPVAIGPNGQVVGAGNHADGSYAPFIWDKAHGLTEIPVENGNPQWVTADGTVWGTSNNSTTFRWDAVRGTQIFPNPDTSPYPSFAFVLIKGTTPEGLAVIQCINALLGYSAFVFDPNTGSSQQLMLPDTSGNNTRVGPPNAAGQVVGSTTAADGTTHGFVWDAAHGIQDLGSGLPGDVALSLAGITDAGQAVGTAYDADGNSHLVLWDAVNGLQDLGVPATDAANVSVTLVSNAGFAGIYNTADGTQHAFFSPLGSAQSPRDTQPPVLTLPGNLTVSATGTSGATVTYAASALGNVEGTLPVTLTPASGSNFPFGTTIVRATVTDAAGFTVNGSFTVTVVNGGPALTVPANITAEATGPSGASVTFSASAIDVITGKSRPVSFSKASGSKFPLGTTVVTVSSTDKAGKTATKTFTVTVRDTTAPTLSLPANRTVKAKGPAGSVVNFTVGATDLVDRNVTITTSRASGSVFPLGTTTVIVTATDDSGNSTSGSFTITVSDQTKPKFTQLSVSPKTLTATNQLVAVTVSASVTDKVDAAPTVRIISITCDETLAAGDAVITGALTANLRASRDNNGNGRIYTLTVQATDASGNTRTRTVHVLVPKKTTTAFEDCDRGRRNEPQRCSDEDRDNDARDRGCEDDND
ncbi:MAG: HYR domain-containing protein [Verrucomicrobia bacterium]|nr:HYR domain-containing protein [Verrucomicrobiota bacterium]